MTFAPWFTLWGDQHLKQFLCIRGSRMQKALGMILFGTEQSRSSLCLRHSRQSSGSSSLPWSVLNHRFHLSSKHRNRSKSWRGNEPPQTDWFCRRRCRAAAVNLHFGHCTDVLQVILPAARAHGWDRNLLSLFPEMCVAAHKPKAKHIQKTQRIAPSPKLGKSSFHALFSHTTHWGVSIISKRFVFGPLMLYMLWLPGHPTQNELVATLAEEPSAKDQRSWVLPSGGGEGRNSWHFSHLVESPWSPLCCYSHCWVWCISSPKGTEQSSSQDNSPRRRKPQEGAFCCSENLF